MANAGEPVMVTKVLKSRQGVQTSDPRGYQARCLRICTGTVTANLVNVRCSGMTYAVIAQVNSGTTGRHRAQAGWVKV